ncbi:MAG: FAD-dependent oxidoreductase [Blastocatellia bacterium]|nr:FAD-dependent oxidoreductase [Blastocatellia bacterium]
MAEHLVIVGGVAAGMTSAVWARRESSSLRITVIERGSEVSYSECGFPYVLSQKVDSLERLIRYSPEKIKLERDIEVMTGTTAKAINFANQSLLISSATKESSIYFDYLILATGAKPQIPLFYTAAMKGIFTLRHFSDARAIEGYLRSSQPKKAVVVGGSFLGLEIAESLTLRGIKVTIIEKTGNLLKKLNKNLQATVEKELLSKGVTINLTEEVLAFDGKETVSRVLTSNREIDTDLVFLATGVEPEVGIAKAAGIRLGRSGAIAVKPTQQTSVANIYAAGDCCDVHHLVSDQPVYLPLGTTANKQGRVAGINVAGGRAELRGVAGTSLLKVFDLEVAVTGLSLQEAKEAGFAARSSYSSSISKAGYYPGAVEIETEIIYDTHTGRLLGAQMVGKEGVAKRVDIFATALYARLRLDDILQLDLGYAPPFAPVWDPVAYAARKAETEE